MDNDDKRISPDDETPPGVEDELEDVEEHSQESDASIDLEEIAADQGEERAENTISFPRLKERDESSEDERDFGMPDFSFFGNEDAKSESTAELKVVDVLAAKSPLGDPPEDETGWQDAGSIERPELFEMAAETAHSEAAREENIRPGGGLEEGNAPRSEATVMPFPGSTVQRSTEPEPSELLRGSSQDRGVDLFGFDQDEPAQAMPDFDPSANDSIADAVQSALRNVYGGTAGEQEEESANFGSYTVAESLRRAAAADETEDIWADDPREWHNGERESYAASAESYDADVNPETVLNNLYGDRRGAPSAMADFNDTSFREQSRPYSAPAPDQGDYEDEPEALDWGRPPYVASSSGAVPGSQYMAPMPSANQESLAAESPDSSHLLGAAGLGLIGGIALAGVLAVFVFNSFVDEGDPTIARVAPKVVERLGSEAGAASTVVENETAATAPADEQPANAPRIAAVQPDPEPPAAAPEPPAAAPEPSPVEKAAAAGQKLYAADAVGKAGQAIPLDIQLTDLADQDATLMSVKGLPAEAKLSTGIDVGGGQWLLPPSRLSDLTVTTPENVSGGFELEVQLLRDDAQTPLSDVVGFSVRVAGPEEAADSTESVSQVDVAAAPQQDDASLSATNVERAAQIAEVPDETPTIETDYLTQLLLRDGNKLMRDGDILGARRLYEQAAANGNPEAALAMGRSFDPSYFEKLPVKTGTPDPATAFQWYKRALDGGLVTARVKIDGLKQWLQR